MQHIVTRVVPSWLPPLLTYQCAHQFSESLRGFLLPRSFRRAAMSLPSPAGNNNPLFVSQWGAGSPSQSQEWVRQTDSSALSLPSTYASRAMSESWAQGRGRTLELLLPETQDLECDGRVEVISPSPQKGWMTRDTRQSANRKPSVRRLEVAGLPSSKQILPNAAAANSAGAQRPSEGFIRGH